MSIYSGNPFVTAAEADAVDRAAFIRRTYGHLAGAIAAFVLVEALLLRSSLAEPLTRMMVGGKGWLVVLLAFMGVSWLADRWARSDASPTMQYLGLGLYTLAEAVIFLPLLAAASMHPGAENVIAMAGIITGLLFVGLTATVFLTRKDFSFMRGILTVGGFVALGVIVCSILFGYNLGLIFSGAMVLFAGGSILYTTSNVLQHYRTDQHVAASLALFSGVMLLLWYVLRILMQSRR